MGVAGQLSRFIKCFEYIFIFLDVLELPFQTASQPDHPFLSYGPSKTPCPRQGVQNDGFFKLLRNPTSHRDSTVILKKLETSATKLWKFQKNLTQIKVFISLFFKQLCTCNRYCSNKHTRFVLGPAVINTHFCKWQTIIPGSEESLVAHVWWAD